ncbi:MAG: sulfite exporter TauE/SafE family protein [Flavobacteriales bacterium]
MDIQTLLLLLCIGLLAGIASGFVGIGGGMIIVPALVFGLGLSQHMAQGTSLAMMIPPIGIIAVMSYYKAGQVQLEYAGVLALTFVLGAWMGSKWALRINPSVVRLVFGLFMLFTAGRLILKSWSDLNP